VLIPVDVDLGVCGTGRTASAGIDFRKGA
jgi:hypothetical protein